MGQSQSTLTAVIAIAVVLAGCGGSTDDGSITGAGTDSTAEGTADGVSAEDVAGFESIDRRGLLLSQLGSPDAFVIKADEIAGEVSRFESWSYFEAGSQIDLIDGEVLWDVEVDELPDGSWLPLAYDPLDFTLLSSVADTLAPLAGTDLRSLSDAAIELDVEGAEIWAGEQLTLVFIDDALIYVEAFPLAPAQPEE